MGHGRVKRHLKGRRNLKIRAGEMTAEGGRDGEAMRSVQHQPAATQNASPEVAEMRTLGLCESRVHTQWNDKAKGTRTGAGLRQGSATCRGGSDENTWRESSEEKDGRAGSRK